MFNSETQGFIKVGVWDGEYHRISQDDWPGV